MPLVPKSLPPDQVRSNPEVKRYCKVIDNWIDKHKAKGKKESFHIHSGGKVTQKVSGTVYGGLGLHKGPSKWTVTHLASGLSIANLIPNKPAAIRYIRAVLPLADWATLTKQRPLTSLRKIACRTIAAHCSGVIPPVANLKKTAQFLKALEKEPRKGDLRQYDADSIMSVFELGVTA